MTSNQPVAPLQSITVPATLKKIYFKAYATSECDDGPEWAEERNVAGFIEQLVKLHKLVEAQSLTEARILLSPDLWGPAGTENDLRLQCGELVVTASCFWYRDTPKYAQGHIETEAQDTCWFLKMISESDKEAIFLANDENEEVRLAERVAKFSEDEEEGTHA